MRRFVMMLAALMGFTAVLTAPAMAQEDPLSRVNAIRAAHGLSAVGWDNHAASESAANNSYQAAKGIVGHFAYSGPQNSAMAGNVSDAFAMWMTSTAHRATILNPGLVAIGYHQWGSWHTLTGRTANGTYATSQVTSQTTVATGQCSTGPGRGFHPFRRLFGRRR